uniref:Uncharacterized protein n=1 Tax=Pyramimonas obovata TaxID=1411642 RepID=A0A7S0RK66_9CHLO|mmetsp:Transcript_3629/g.7546  ORF Transcript_3629/g.7546 Transcript_3629/m.7546 type:complete len:418 (+) Transcript_3629:336-1589(+)
MCLLTACEAENANTVGIESSEAAWEGADLRLSSLVISGSRSKSARTLLQAQDRRGRSNEEDHEDHEDHEEKENDGRHVELKLAIAVGIFALAVVGGLIPISFHMRLSGDLFDWVMSALNLFSGGVFLAASLTHIVPHVLENAETIYGKDNHDTALEVGQTLVLIGYVILLLVDRVLLPTSHSHSYSQGADAGSHECALPAVKDHELEDASAARVDKIYLDAEEAGTEGAIPSASGSMKIIKVFLIDTAAVAPLFIGMSLHAFTAGLLLGVTNDRVDVMVICWAIIAHKAPEVLSFATKLIKTGRPLLHTVVGVVVFSLITPLGVVTGIISLSAYSEWVNMALGAMSAGTFLYMGTAEAVLGDLKVEQSALTGKAAAMPLVLVRLAKFVCYAFGIGVILLVTHLQDHANHAGHDDHGH